MSYIHRRVLVITGTCNILSAQLTVIVREICIAETSHYSQVICTILLIPVYVSIAYDVCLLREDRRNLAIYSAQVLHIERWHTSKWTIICLCVTVQVVTEVRSCREVWQDVPCRSNSYVEECILILVLTLAITFLYQSNWVTYRILVRVE